MAPLMLLSHPNQGTPPVVLAQRLPLVKVLIPIPLPRRTPTLASLPKRLPLLRRICNCKSYTISMLRFCFIMLRSNLYSRICLAEKVANMSATCCPDSQMLAHLVKMPLSWQHNFDPDTFCVCQDLPTSTTFSSIVPEVHTENSSLSSDMRVTVRDTWFLTTPRK